MGLLYLFFFLVEGEPKLDMEFLQQAITVLELEQSAALAGFAVGVFGEFAIESPLSSLFFGAIMGSLYGYGAVTVRSMFPSQLMPIVPLACAAYAVHQLCTGTKRNQTPLRIHIRTQGGGPQGPLS